MKLILAFRLFGFVIGVALQLSLFLLIKRYRRIEKLEVLFLCLIASLFFWNLCNFLYHVFKIAQVHSFLTLSVESLAFCVLAFLPSLLLHTHLVFQQKYLASPLFRLNRTGELAIYAPLSLMPWAVADFLKSYDPTKSLLTATVYARPFAAWFSFSLLASVLIEWRMLQQSEKPQERNLYRVLIIIFLMVAGLIFYTYYLSDFDVRLEAGGYFEALLMLWSIIPSALLGYYIFRYNFLEIAIEGKIRFERELAERDKMATLGQMAATVAHNIKNPLSSIKTIIQLMQEDGEVQGKYARDLSLINSEIDRLSHSVSQLLKFSKPTVLLATARVDVQQVLEKTVQIFKPEADRRGIRLEMGSVCQPQTVCGSEEVLSEIFQNLIVNAIEVSPEQSHIAIRTHILENAAGKKAVVYVEDEGPGIAPGIKQQIFRPFFTTKQKGTGLGLAVVHRRVTDLGGEIDCISPLSQNGGTRFEVRLPLIVE